MNRPIMRLFAFVAVLFALLVAFTSRWTVFEASSLRSNPLKDELLCPKHMGLQHMHCAGFFCLG